MSLIVDRTLGAVIRRFVDFVKTESLNIAAFDLRGMLSRVSSREVRGRPGAEVVLADGEMGALTGDEQLLERAFENLVRNGREAAGPQGRVWIEVRREGSMVFVTVSDDGPGVGAELDSFRPFFTTKPGGLGLGLPIAHKIVGLHNGQLSMEARIPRGLMVRVRFGEGFARDPIVTNRTAPNADRAVTRKA